MTIEELVGRAIQIKTSPPERGEQEDGSWRIYAVRVPELIDAVDRRARRARRTGGGGLRLVVEAIERYEWGETSRGGMRVTRTTLHAVVRIAGEVPRLDGHQFVARIEHTAAGNLIAHAPDAREVELPIALRTAAPTCDHCRAKRDRKDTFVLRREADGALVRVGRTCLGDYLRGADPAEVLALWRYLGSMTELLAGAGSGDEFAGGARQYMPVATYLTAVVSSVRHCGWFSRAMVEQRGGGTTTAAHADWLCGQEPQNPESAREWRAMQPTAEDAEEARAVIAWVAATIGEKPLEARTEYEHNLVIALQLGIVTRRTYGIVASAVAAKRRHDGEVAQRNAPAAGSEHVGEVGKRQTFRLIVMAVAHFDGQYGTTTLLTMRDGDGNKLKWFASGTKNPTIGEAVVITAAVKAHGEYRGVKETIITRGVFVPTAVVAMGEGT